MKLAYPLFLLGMLTLIACTSKSAKDVEKTGLSLEKTVVQAFTDTIQQDTFKIALNGQESKQMNLVFTITDYKGTQIYKKEIKADDLLKSYLASADLKSEREKIKFLNDEINFFFNEEHFLAPAVTPEEKPDHNMPDKAFYEELKQSKLNGFGYRLGKDKNVYIAWSAKAQKVKIYYQCC